MAAGTVTGWVPEYMQRSLGVPPAAAGCMLVVAPFNAVGNTVAQMIAPSALRSRISAMFIFSVSVLGFTVGPALVGWLSEFVFGEERLGEAIRLVTTLAMAATFTLFLLAGRPLRATMQARSAIA